MQVRPSLLLKLSGAVWLIVGTMLFKLGVTFMLEGYQGIVFVTDHYSSLFDLASSIFGGQENAVLFYIILGLGLGYYKYRKVLKKQTQKAYDRISQLPELTPIWKIYNKQSYLILIGMMALGMCFKYLPFPFDIRGIIDITVGAALIQGSILFFRMKIDPATSLSA